MITAHKRGHLIKYVNGSWVYVDNETSVEIERPCARCGRMPTLEGYEACLGFVEGVSSACCGHGVEQSYAVTVIEHG